MNQFIKHAVAASAAILTTLMIFTAVASLADEDKAALIAARIKPTTIAAQSVDAIKR